MHWAVIGGGMLGMTLAHRLAQRGQPVTLFEAAPSLGGLADAWKLGEIVWDRHYHVTLLSDSRLRALLRELGLEQEMQWVRTRTGFYTDGVLYSMSNLVEFLRFPPLGLVDKLRLAATIFYASRIKNWRPLEAVSAESWLRRWSGGRTFEKIWLPLLRSKLGENYRLTSAAFIWAIIARLYAARRTGMKEEMFGYVPGGYARILEDFAGLLTGEGVRLHLNHNVTGVVSEPGARVRVDIPGASRSFDRVILTVPAPVATRLCAQLSDEEKHRWNAIRYQGILCASLLVKRPLSGFYVTNITDSWVPFTAVIASSALVDRRHFAGNCLIYLPKYLDSESEAFNLSDAEIERSFLGGLERMYPGFDSDDVICFRVSRVRHVLPLSTINYSAMLPSMQTSVPGVCIVNSAHIVNGTLNVNETVQLAERTASEFLGSEP